MRWGKRYDDYDEAKFVNTMPSHFGSYILSHRRRLMNDVIKQKGGFYNKSIYYIDTDSLYIHKKYWSFLVDNGSVGIFLGWGKSDYGNSGLFHAWFLSPKKVLSTDWWFWCHFGVTSKVYSEEHRIVKMNKFVSLSERKTFSGK